MSNIAASFASLVKYNGGFFKSDKQAAFLLSQCIDGAFIAFNTVYKNTSKTWYLCDEKGVYLVQKENTIKGCVVVKGYWKRGELPESLTKDLVATKAKINDCIAYAKDHANELGSKIDNLKSELETGTKNILNKVAEEPEEAEEWLNMLERSKEFYSSKIKEQEKLLKGVLKDLAESYIRLSGKLEKVNSAINRG